MSTAILFTCPQCKTMAHAKADWLGKKVKCPKCGFLSRVTAPQQAQDTQLSPQVTPEAPEAVPGRPSAETVHDLQVRAPTRRWEYHVVRHELIVEGELTQKMTEDMNRWGAEGWECVSVLPHFGVVVVYKRQVE